MKRLTFIMILMALLPMTIFSQDMNLEKLSKPDREKQLFETAMAAMKKYAPSYYKEDLVPIIAYEGTISDEEDKDYGRKVYRIDFPFDLGKAISENREGENIYGGSVGIRGTGKVYNIRPTGWWTSFEIPDESDVQSGVHGSPAPVAKPGTVPRNPFKDW